MTLSALYTKTHTLPVAISMFSGLQAMIVAIIANATMMFGRSSLKNRQDIIIAGAAAAIFGLGVNPIVVILLTALLGLLLNHGRPQPDTKSAPVKRTTNKEVSLVSRPLRGLRLDNALPDEPEAVRSCCDYGQDRSVCLWRRIRFCASHVP